MAHYAKIVNGKVETVIVAESEIEDANEAIRKALPPRLQDTPEPTLKIKRDYSSTLRLCSFGAWIAPAP